MTNSSDNSRKEHRALRLTAVILVIAIAILIASVVLCRACSVDASAKGQPDYERIAELVELKDGVLSERRNREQETSEEREHIASVPTEQSDLPTGSAVSETEQAAQMEEETVLDDVQVDPQYRFNQSDEVIPAEILNELEAWLYAYSIEWWLPIAKAQMFQESHCNPYAENRNGLDKGLYQYRTTYWSAMCVEHGLPAETSIFDWRAQIRIYVSDTARRLYSGCSVEDTISRHMMSDYGHYNAKYVNDVLQWTR